MAPSDIKNNEVFEMVELVLTLAIYSVIMLIFVPLEKIARWQTSVRKQWQKLLDKSKE